LNKNNFLASESTSEMDRQCLKCFLERKEKNQIREDYLPESALEMPDNHIRDVTEMVPKTDSDEQKEIREEGIFIPGPRRYSTTRSSLH